MPVVNTAIDLSWVDQMITTKGWVTIHGHPVLLGSPDKGSSGGGGGGGKANAVSAPGVGSGTTALKKPKSSTEPDFFEVAGARVFVDPKANIDVDQLKAWIGSHPKRITKDLLVTIKAQREGRATGIAMGGSVSITPGTMGDLDNKHAFMHEMGHHIQSVSHLNENEKWNRIADKMIDAPNKQKMDAKMIMAIASTVPSHSVLGARDYRRREAFAEGWAQLRTNTRHFKENHPEAYAVLKSINDEI